MESGRIRMEGVKVGLDDVCRIRVVYHGDSNKEVVKDVYEANEIPGCYGYEEGDTSGVFYRRVVKGQLVDGQIEELCQVLVARGFLIGRSRRGNLVMKVNTERLMTS